MSTIGLIQIHDMINRNNGECCYICFRPATERRLVEPVSLDALLSKLSIVTFFTLHKNTQVCYVCEALAKSAFRFIKAVEIAAKVGELFSEMSQEDWHNIESHLKVKPGKVTGTEVPDNTRRALRIDRALRGGAGARYSLQRTDTLVVGGPARPPPPPAPPRPAPMQLSSDLVVVMNSEEPSPLAPRAAPVLRPRSLEAHVSVDTDEQHVRVLNQETNEFILHPMVKGTDGNIYVPSLQVQLLDNGILRSVTKTQLQNLSQNCVSNNVNNSTTLSSIVTNVSASSNVTVGSNVTGGGKVTVGSNVTAGGKVTVGNNVIAGSNVVTGSKVYAYSNKLKSGTRGKNNDKEKNDYYAFLASQTKHRGGFNDVDIIKIDDLNIVLNDNSGKKRKHDEELDHTLSEVTRLLSENTQGACEIKYELIDDDDEPSSKAPDNVSASSNVSTGSNVPDSNRGSARVTAGNTTGSNTSKEPVLRTDRTVDWEDKIPMDVISFMDATDPNPSERIMQPRTYPSPTTAMGVICDVRSVPDVPDVPETQELECIDLC